MWVYGTRLKDNDFDLNISGANKAKTEREKSMYYDRAIKIRPYDTTGYLGLIDCIKEDGVFSLEEEENMDRKLNLNINFLKNNDNYGMLAYQMGKLYWYYYDYGNDSEKSSGMKAGAGWFEDAIYYLPKDSEAYSISMVYAKIGGFLRDITLNIEEAEDTGMYMEYFENLKSLMEIAREEKNEIVRLSSVKLVMSSIDTYSGKFIMDGVNKRDLMGLFEKSREVLVNTLVNTEKTMEMKMELEGKVEYIKDNLTAKI